VARSAAPWAAEQRSGLLRGHRPVPLGGDVSSVLERDVEELSFADAHARFVDQLCEREHALGRESIKALQCQTRSGEHAVARIDRLGYAPHAPDRRPVMARRILVLDVVVDEREVVEELDRGGRRKRATGVAGERLVDERAEHRAEPFTRGSSSRVQPEVVQHHPVEGLKRRVRAGQKSADLLVDGGDVCLESSTHRGSIICAPRLDRSAVSYH
jgi:hypothetical protein